MAEKLLLHLQYECSRYKIDLPWESAAHRLHPGSSGGALLQHMNRLRNMLVAEGHLVPPICQKPGSKVQVDPKIRGYVRRHESGPDTATTRPVLFSEPLDDRRFNLPDAYDDYNIPGSVKRSNMGGQSRRRAIKIESPDPAGLDGDGDYNAGSVQAGPSTRRSKRARLDTSYIEEEHTSVDSDDEEDESSEDDEEDNEEDGDEDADEDDADEDGDEDPEDDADDDRDAEDEEDDSDQNQGGHYRNEVIAVSPPPPPPPCLVEAAADWKS